MGNTLFSAAAAISYSIDHDLRFTMPSETPNKFWKALYLQHLVDPEFTALESNALKVIELKECGFPYHPIEFKPVWAEDHLIVINGYRQSEKYFAHHRERVLEALGFPWVFNEGWVAVHVRRGDYLVHKNKHPAVTKEWYEAQMEKFPGCYFQFYSDDIDWCRMNFRDHPHCHFEQAIWTDLPDTRPEVVDLVSGSCCEHVIGSASTFALWMGLLGRNPGRRVIIPTQWICEGWESTTADTWRDVVPTTQGWERA